jgi:hypothetical protein
VTIQSPRDFKTFPVLRQPAAPTGFCAISYRENYDLWAAANPWFDEVCGVKNRPIGDF